MTFFSSHHLKIRNFSFVRISDFLFTTHGARRYIIKRTTRGIVFLGKSLLVDLIKRPLVYIFRINVFFVTTRKLLVTAPDCDSICATRIFVALLRTEHITT